MQYRITELIIRAFVSNDVIRNAIEFLVLFEISTVFPFL